MDPELHRDLQRCINIAKERATPTGRHKPVSIGHLSEQLGKRLSPAKAAALLKNVDCLDVKRHKGRWYITYNGKHTGGGP